VQPAKYFFAAAQHLHSAVGARLGLSRIVVSEAELPGTEYHRESGSRRG
jgi:hypothetical protein